jgi:hypothetical protein
MTRSKQCAWLRSDRAELARGSLWKGGAAHGTGLAVPVWVSAPKGATTIPRKPLICEG